MALILTPLCCCSYAAIRLRRILVSPGSLVGGRSFVTTVSVALPLAAPHAASRLLSPITPTPVTAPLRMNARRERVASPRGTPEVREGIWLLLYNDRRVCHTAPPKGGGIVQDAADSCGFLRYDGTAKAPSRGTTGSLPGTRRGRGSRRRREKSGSALLRERSNHQAATVRPGHRATFVGSERGGKICGKRFPSRSLHTIPEHSAVVNG